MDSKQKFTEKVSNELKNSLLIFILLLSRPLEEHGQAAQEPSGKLYQSTWKIKKKEEIATSKYIP